MERTAFLWVDQMSFVEESMVTELYSHYTDWHTFASASLNVGLTFMRKKEPDTLINSHLTTTIFWPLSACLAMMEARRPKRCPNPL